KALQSQQTHLCRYTYNPVAQIGEIIGIPEGLPLFDQAIVLDAPPLDLLSNGNSGGLRIRDIEISGQTDVSITLTPQFGRDISLEITYDSRRFDGVMISAMLK